MISGSLFVNHASMSNGLDRHDIAVIVQLADDAKTSDPITVQAKLVMAQRFAEVARIVRTGNPIIHVIEDFDLHGRPSR
jgi:hypothetical protein